MAWQAWVELPFLGAASCACEEEADAQAFADRWQRLHPSWIIKVVIIEPAPNQAVLTHAQAATAHAALVAADKEKYMSIDPLIVDAYAGDFGGHPNIGALIAAGPPWHGIIFKATEGTYYPYTTAQRDWFCANWLPARILAMERYGAPVGATRMAPGAIGEPIAPWFRGAYHYMRIDQDPIRQADLFLKLVELAGGWGPGDLWPMVDVESAENPAKPSTQQIVDAVSLWASKITSAIGRTPMLYGNVYLAEHGVTSHMNCGTLTVARYKPDLPSNIYQRIGWQLAKPAAMPTLWGWQYSGDPEGGSLVGYPTKTPLSATENADIIAIVAAGGGQAALDWTTANLGH